VPLGDQRPAPGAGEERREGRVGEVLRQEPGRERAGGVGLGRRGERAGGGELANGRLPEPDLLDRTGGGGGGHRDSGGDDGRGGTAGARPTSDAAEEGGQTVRGRPESGTGTSLYGPTAQESTPGPATRRTGAPAWPGRRPRRRSPWRGCGRSSGGSPRWG